MVFYPKKAMFVMKADPNTTLTPLELQTTHHSVGDSSPCLGGEPDQPRQATRPHVITTNNII
jgi:hypothetical protein